MSLVTKQDGILVVNKEEGYTSFDVVARLRGILGVRKIGHAGTLDPMATGVLPTFVGNATKAIPFLENHDKAYLATFQLGICTDTQDRTGEVLSTSPVSVGVEQVRAALSSFLGHQMQLPPMYSAVKVGGKRLYELARAGKTVEREPRPVIFYEISLSSFDEEQNEYTIFVRCSKGTYIRTLCNDLGEKLGCGGVLNALHRTEACGYRETDSASILTLEQIEQQVKKGTKGLLLPVESAFISFPKGVLLSKDAVRFVNGQKLEMNRLEERISGAGDIWSVFEKGGSFLGLAQESAGHLKPLRIFLKREG